MDDIDTTIMKANVADTDTADTRRLLLMAPERLCIDIIIYRKRSGIDCKIGSSSWTNTILWVHDDI